MDEFRRANVWKLTAIGMMIAAVTAVVTGLVVANRMGTREASVETPASAPGALVTPQPAATSRPPAVAQAPAAAPAAPAGTAVQKPAGVPPSNVVDACNRQAAAAAGSAPRQGTDKAIDIAKDAGIGALGGAAVGAVGGAIADGGKGAGKGALIGGALGAGGGTLYGIWDNKKNDERFRAAYSSCMKSRGYNG